MEPGIAHTFVKLIHQSLIWMRERIPTTTGLYDDLTNLAAVLHDLQEQRALSAREALHEACTELARLDLGQLAVLIGRNIMAAAFAPLMQPVEVLRFFASLLVVGAAAVGGYVYGHVCAHNSAIVCVPINVFPAASHSPPHTIVPAAPEPERRSWSANVGMRATVSPIVAPVDQRRLLPPYTPIPTAPAARAATSVRPQAAAPTLPPVTPSPAIPRPLTEPAALPRPTRVVGELRTPVGTAPAAFIPATPTRARVGRSESTATPTSTPTSATPTLTPATPATPTSATPTSAMPATPTSATPTPTPTPATSTPTPMPMPTPVTSSTPTSTPATPTPVTPTPTPATSTPTPTLTPSTPTPATPTPTPATLTPATPMPTPVTSSTPTSTPATPTPVTPTPTPATSTPTPATPVTSSTPTSSTPTPATPEPTPIPYPYPYPNP